jgi:uncharacterized damage-inducible protein DinB
MRAREILIDTYPHLPPLRALDGLDPDAAHQRLLSTPHSIAEIVAHMSFWQDWFYQRCEGRHAPIVATASLGWPAVEAGSWPDLLAAFRAGLEKAASIGSRAAEPLTPAIEFPPLAHYTVADALVHIAQHNSHHVGQIVLLRQLMAQWPPPGGGFTW